MRKIAVLMLCALLTLSACRDGAVQKGIWIPVLEGTGFSYLKTAGGRLQVAMEELRSNLAKGQLSEARQSLENAEEKVRILIYYDIPITKQFSELGHKVNMMAIKGDLILSGVDFNQTHQDPK